MVKHYYTIMTQSWRLGCLGCLKSILLVSMSKSVSWSKSGSWSKCWCRWCRCFGSGASSSLQVATSGASSSGLNRNFPWIPTPEGLVWRTSVERSETTQTAAMCTRAQGRWRNRTRRNGTMNGDPFQSDSLANVCNDSESTCSMQARMRSTNAGNWWMKPSSVVSQADQTCCMLLRHWHKRAKHVARTEPAWFAGFGALMYTSVGNLSKPFAR